MAASLDLSQTPQPGPGTTRPSASGRGLRLLGHFAEMVAAMFAGMIVLGAGRSWLGLTVDYAERPLLSYVLMATDMAVAMAAWMLLRGHGWPVTTQMCAAMYVPVITFPLVTAGLIDAMTFMVLVHVLMVVVMAALVWLHRDEHRTHH